MCTASSRGRRKQEGVVSKLLKRQYDNKRNHVLYLDSTYLKIISKRQKKNSNKQKRCVREYDNTVIYL